jgi:hypothetical protein
MADSNAVRSRRKRLHSAGDHSECRRCDGRSVTVVPPLPAGTGSDPRARLESLAARLEAAHEASPSDAMLARVLKDVLLALGAVPAKGDGGELGEFLARIRR